jgi:hypothetical protein
MTTKHEDKKLKEAYRKFYEENKEIMKKKNKEYYNTHKDKANEKKVCECRGRYSVKNYTTHVKTQIHQNYLKEKENKKKNKKKVSDSESSDESSDESSSESD